LDSFEFFFGRPSDLSPLYWRSLWFQASSTSMI
jgi:hypothetical protein